MKVIIDLPTGVLNSLENLAKASGRSRKAFMEFTLIAKSRMKKSKSFAAKKQKSQS